MITQPPPAPGGPSVQERLRAATADRIRAARPDLAGRYDLGSARGLLAVQDELGAADPADGYVAAVVIGRFDLVSWARATCEFALGLDPSAAAGWRRSFTRTVFLAGNPDNLRGRFSFAHADADGSAAWTAPGPAADSAALRRLLKLFSGPLPLPLGPAVVLTVPAGPGPPPRPPVHREVHVAVADCRVQDVLVHLNHLLAEAVLDGLVGPGDRLTLRRVPRLSGLAHGFAALRATTEPTLPGRLRAVAGLTLEVPLDHP
ncbi:DUF6182 family protein [Streptomyces sp. cg36]|uniref:DUF6182 family protein n=1 Tax=Streptomyces sp. cg36 TaxID=3238798 RepID=UPI0034E1A64F